MGDEGFTGQQIAGYTFEAPVPDGFDPNSEGWRQIPEGLHEVDLVFGEKGTSVFSNHTFKVRNVGEFCLNQLRPRLRVVSGAHAGATIMDFLPMPTPEVDWPKELANVWANFARSWGGDIPAGMTTPPGFALTEAYFANRTCIIKVVSDFDELKIRKTTRGGEPQNRVAFFGYSRVPFGGHVPSTLAAAPAPSQARESVAAVTAPPDEIEL